MPGTAGNNIHDSEISRLAPKAINALESRFGKGKGVMFVFANQLGNNPN